MGVLRTHAPVYNRATSTMVTKDSRTRRVGALIVIATFSLLSACSGPRAVSQEPTPPPDTANDQAPIPVKTQNETDDFAPEEMRLDTVTAGRFDNGKMWTFDFPPSDYFAETYGFGADDEWFERARLGTLRLPNCTASFVSANGLALTNHHCARGQVTQVSAAGENLPDNGFYAEDLEDERPVPGWYADQLIAIQDVTDEVDAAVAGAETDAERAAARQQTIADIQSRIAEEEGGTQNGITVQVVSLYSGAIYSAYTFRRFTDLRLVMVPEHLLGFFGGDTDNFTYPRYALDFTLFRVYENGEPYQPKHHFSWGLDGAEAGDAVFLIGNPGSTNRLETTAQLAWRRDAQEKASLEFLSSAAEILAEVYATDPDPQLRNLLFSVRNSEKAYTGRVKGLNDEILMQRRKVSERAFQDAIEADPALSERYGTVIADVAGVVRQKMEYAEDYLAFIGLPASALTSATLRRAILAAGYLKAQDGGASDDQLLQRKNQVASISDQEESLDRTYLLNRLHMMQNAWGENSDMMNRILNGRSPQELVSSIMENSVLTSSASASSAINDGSLSSDDPAIAFAETIVDRMMDMRSALAGLQAREQELGRLLGRARFEVYGTDVPPDATFSLRIADGVVQAYEYNGTRAPIYTTYYGLLDHFYSYGRGEGEGAEWDLPDRWLDPPSEFDLSTPLNIVSTNDIIGGNSGSPLVNANLEVVGVAFDGNIESLPWSFIYRTDVGRTVSVDSRAILESLDNMYDLDRLVLELTEGELVKTNEEADAHIDG